VLIVIALVLVGLVVAAWLLTVGLHLAVWAVKATYWVLRGACYLIWGLCLAVYATGAGIWDLSRWIIARRASRTAWQVADYRARQAPDAADAAQL